MSDILKYVSNSGEFSMGGSDHELLRLNAILGLAYPDVERQTFVYSGRSGETTVSTRFLPRAITVSGDVMSKDGLKEIIRILSDSGVLYIETTEGTREIGVIATSMENPQKIGDVMRVCIQFIADDPAFSDIYSTRVGIFERENLVINSFELPCVFTRRVTGGVFYNTGDMEVEPKISIYSNLSEEKQIDLILLNEELGAKIEFSHLFGAGEAIFIDIKKATITDEEGNSLLSDISDDTYLSEFIFKKGKNTINVQTSEALNGLQVVCEYKKKHLEAII